MTLKMSNKITLSETMKSLEKIYDYVVSKDFLSQKWLWNEIPFYIYDYPAEHELLIRNYIKILLKKISKNNHDLKVIEIDLYSIMIDIIKDKGLLKKVIENENVEWSSFIEKALKPIIKAENFNSRIELLSQNCDIIF